MILLAPVSGIVSLPMRVSSLSSPHWIFQLMLIGILPFPLSSDLSFFAQRIYNACWPVPSPVLVGLLPTNVRRPLCIPPFLSSFHNFFSPSPLMIFSGNGRSLEAGFFFYATLLF